jgi:SAM-dependent methyltransferase
MAADVKSEPASWDAYWEEHYRKGDEVRYPPEHLVRFVARNFYRVPERKALRMLDLGTGSGGACAWYMAREGFTVSAIEASPTAVGKARARFAAEGLEVDVRQGDVASLPWPDETFDFVNDSGCLCCNPSAGFKRIVGEVVRVLKPGGAFLSATLTDRSCEYGLGVEEEPGGFRDTPGRGPMSGRFFYLCMGRPQIAEFYRGFESIVVDRVSRTSEGMAFFIEFWIVQCRKAGGTPSGG